MSAPATMATSDRGFLVVRWDDPDANGKRHAMWYRHEDPEVAEWTDESRHAVLFESEDAANEVAALYDNDNLTPPIEVVPVANCRPLSVQLFTLGVRILHQARLTPGKRPVGFVYCAQEEGGPRWPIKIGWCRRDATQRVRTLQVGNPRQLALQAFFPGDLALEHALHKTFAHYRISGEWFRSEPFVVEAIRSVKAIAETVWSR